SLQYIGCLEVKVSMKQLDFTTRSTVAKQVENYLCETAGLKNVDKKRKIDKKILRSIADSPKMEYAGTNVNLNISSSRLTLTSLETCQVIANHDMPQISFASGGDTDTLDFVAYIAKDITDWRACFVLECGGGLAKDVIATIGQAFELRYEQYMKPAHKEYYNDLPGKVPPDVGPPPVPPLPLKNEIWFHGQISRAEAEKLLQKDGDFLVRESPASEGQYVLSGMQENTKKHLLLIDPEGVVRTKDRMFQSVSHLINYHCEYSLPIISAESAMVLRTPIPR
ncbi:hypothetical protein FQA39_LY04543, partial [Lamprigera yunnana]